MSFCTISVLSGARQRVSFLFLSVVEEKVSSHTRELINSPRGCIACHG